MRCWRTRVGSSYGKEHDLAYIFPVVEIVMCRSRFSQREDLPHMRLDLSGAIDNGALRLPLLRQHDPYRSAMRSSRASTAGQGGGGVAAVERLVILARPWAIVMGL